MEINGTLGAKLRNLKGCKSTGVDNISARLLKITAPSIAPSITKSMYIAINKMENSECTSCAIFYPLCNSRRISCRVSSSWVLYVCLCMYCIQRF